MPVKPAMSRRDSLRLLGWCLRVRRRPLVLAVAASLGYLVSVLCVPLLTRWAVDDVVAGGRRNRLGTIVTLLLVVGLARALFGVARQWQASKLMAGVGLDLRNRIYEHLQRLSFADHERLGAGTLLTRVSSDVTLLESMVSVIPFFLQSILVGVVGSVVLVVLSPLLASVVVVVALVGGVVALRLARPIHDLSMAVQRALDRFAHFADQQVTGIRVVKGHALERPNLATGTQHAAAVADAGVRLVATRARFWAAFITIPGAAIVAVLGLGGRLAAEGRMTVGELLAFVQYLGLLITPIAVGAQMLSLWPLTLTALKRMDEVLSTEPDVTDPPAPVPMPSGPGTIRFDNVRFGYRPGVPVLRGLTLTVPGGTSVALVGMSGSGKTTLTRLVPRFYDAWSGSVTLDGVDVRRLRLDQLRRATSVVFEDTVVFADSIEENIAMSAPEASPDEVRTAARLARVDEFVERLPDGYATEVGERGTALSGGQRQRLAIARALLRSPRVLILDDATSALDPRLSESVRAGLAAAIRGRTALIVAHHVDTVRLADRVVLLDDGQVVADGTHDELLALPAYRRALGLEGDDPALCAG